MAKIIERTNSTTKQSIGSSSPITVNFRRHHDGAAYQMTFPNEEAYNKFLEIESKIKELGQKLYPNLA